MDPDVKIPGRPYSFARLFEAQAAGDVLALEEHGRPVFRVKLQNLLEAAGIRA